jgi:Peptidase family M28
MLRPNQRALVLGCCLAMLLLMGLVIALGLHQSRPLPLDRVAPRFDPAAAIGYTRILAQDYPDRVTGSPGAARAAEYLKAEFQKMGYHVSGDLFNMWLAGKRVEGQNVVAEVPGEVRESVAVIAHYDSQFTSHQAAEDNASGVGTLLELARGLNDQPHHRGLIFVATDAEEWGMIGARALRGFFRTRQTLAVMSIDYLTQGRPTVLAIDCEGQGGGYSPIWLRELIHQSGALQGVVVEGPTPFQEWIERSVEVSAQDQGPLLRVGIPAINLSTSSADEAGARARYHSVHDVFENFQPGTFQMVGVTVEQALSTLDKVEPPPPPEVKYLSLTGGRWLDRNSVEWLQTLGLVPFMLACVLAVLNYEDDHLEHPPGTYLRPILYLVPLLAMLAALYALTSVGVLTRYEFYPATPKDPFLYSVPSQVIVPLVGVLLMGYIIVRILRLFLPPPPTGFATCKRILCVWMFLLVIWALYLNPFAMWFFLGPLAYSFVLLQRPLGWTSRVANAALLLLGALPLAVLLYFFGREIYLGWRILWYLVLQTAYGVWSVSAATLFLLALALWLQLFRLGVFAPRSNVQRVQLGGVAQV